MADLIIVKARIIKKTTEEGRRKFGFESYLKDSPQDNTDRSIPRFSSAIFCTYGLAF